ncbi:TRAP transporter small permease subunit [Sneathiella sp. P13V-1]|uniref:TRAP transporter small permease n=1 Tax=Sneathiella sp. P13V-1 TaxID=2697366 RepID=UPI00187BC3C6|nr:TRAP transporter small permease [Sneathiella sp. P13V-1]MBE7638387.1 TRAP transporter small permease subunit [Sneathiella sp. P13V-1]
MLSIVDKISKLAAVISGGILVSMVGFILLEIVLRSFFSASTFVLDEFVGYGIAIMTFLSFSMALKEGAFIRVNLLIAHLNVFYRRIFEVIFCFGGITLFSYVAFYLSRTVWRNFDRGVTSNSIAEVPLWIPQSLMLLGVVILVLQFAALFISYLRGAPISNTSEEL